MTFSVNKLPKSQVEILFQISAEELNSYYDSAVLHLNEHVKIEGFRSGHIPKDILEKQIGQAKILEEATNTAIRENYRKAITESKLEPISHPEIEILKIAHNNPFEFKAKISVLPEVSLPDYRKVAKETKKGEVKVQDKDIEDSLKWLQKSRAKLSLKTGACVKGDFVEMTYSCPEIEAGKEMKDGFILGEGHFVPGFEANLEGMEANGEKEFIIEFPKDTKDKNANFFGKNLSFKVKVTNVQNVELPEITDEWVKTIGNFENIEALKKNINDGILHKKEHEAKDKRRAEILTKIAEASKVEIPDALIQGQQNQMLESMKNNVKSQTGMEFNDYLKKINKTEEEIKKTFFIDAEKLVKNSLALREIAKKENIAPSEEEIMAKVNEFLKEYQDLKTAEKEVDLNDLKSYYEGILRDEKVFELLEKLG